jgi:5'-3' exoribonuclease 1
MLDLNNALEFFIQYKIANDEEWRKIDVIFSGVDVPGEGEHKLMTYMRENRGEPDVRHCFYGLDADLIMLALLSHEPYIFILRETVRFGRQRGPQRKVVGEMPEFKLLFINVLREYLQNEFSTIPDFERFINDYVLICFLVGNDFIPRLPSFEIATGSLDFLLRYYKQQFNGVYLTDGAWINWDRFQDFLIGLQRHETDNIES